MHTAPQRASMTSGSKRVLPRSRNCGRDVTARSNSVRWSSMHFADPLLRISFAGTLIALVSGCALLTGPEMPQTSQAPTAAPAQAKPEAPAAAAASNAKAPAAPTQNTAPSVVGAVAQVEPSAPVEAEVPLTPTVQREFE